MADHQTAKDVEEKLAEQNADNYGDEAPGGHMASPDSDDDVERNVADAFGDDAGEQVDEGIPFNIADELNKDELGAGGITTDEKAKENIKRSEKKQK